MICVKVNRDLRLRLFRWLEKNTTVHMPDWGLGPKYMFFDGINNIHLIFCPSGEPVTPNEFKRRVQAACGKGE